MLSRSRPASSTNGKIHSPSRLACSRVNCGSADGRPVVTASSCSRVTRTSPISYVSILSSLAPSGPQQFLDGAMRLINRRIRVGRGAGVRVGDGDAAAARPADLVRRGSLRPVRIEQRVILVGITVRPAVDGDGGDVAFLIEPAG